MEPSARVELATPSLPRTCSTPELRGLTRETGCRFSVAGDRTLRQLTTDHRELFWSGRRGSNPGPTAWKAVTLPTELLPLASETVKNGGEWRIRTFVGRGPADLQSA